MPNVSSDRRTGGIPRPGTSRQYTAPDGTVWEEIQPNVNPCVKISTQNILRETPGPTSHGLRQMHQKSTICLRQMCLM